MTSLGTWHGFFKVLEKCFTGFNVLDDFVLWMPQIQEKLEEQHKFNVSDSD